MPLNKGAHSFIFNRTLQIKWLVLLPNVLRPCGTGPQNLPGLCYPSPGKPTLCFLRTISDTHSSNLGCYPSKMVKGGVVLPSDLRGLLFRKLELLVPHSYLGLFSCSYLLAFNSARIQQDIFSLTLLIKFSQQCLRYMVLYPSEKKAKRVSWIKEQVGSHARLHI